MPISPLSREMVPSDEPKIILDGDRRALLNLSDGCLHVAGIGGVPSDLGWTVDKAKQFSPRLGVTNQLDP